MEQKKYNVAVEIAGPAAMFTRPDSGATPISSLRIYLPKGKMNILQNLNWPPRQCGANS
ncbi:MAG: hypothetical protein ABR512_11790 [Desulfopila sp.]